MYIKSNKQNRDMKEILKINVSEVNLLLNSDYNLISFDTLPKDTLLQILCDLFHYIGAFEKVNYIEKYDEAILKIFQTLKAIHYSPCDDNGNPILPEVFREGVAAGDRNIIQPIIYYIVTNKEQCKKYSYLSKYMTPIEIPDKVIEQDFDVLKMEYDKVRKEFWEAFKENKKREKNASKSNELKQDIDRMSKDMGNLSLRIEKQKEKIDSLPQKALYMGHARTYRQEIMQRKKLTDQYREMKELVFNLNEEKNNLKVNLELKRRNRLSYEHLLQSINQEVNVNKIMVSSQLPMSMMGFKRQLEICKVIATEFIPNRDELDNLEYRVKVLDTEISRLIERKNMLLHSSDDQLGPFRNQAKVISNKKMQYGEQVRLLKEALSEVGVNIEKCSRLLHDLVGGEILHGSELKAYIASLREQSVVYKNCRVQLQGVNGELALLIRTLDILYLLDPSIEEQVKLKKSEQKSTDLADNLGDIKLKCRRFAGEIDQYRTAYNLVREEMANLRESFHNIEENYIKNKNTFEEATGLLGDDVKKLEFQIQDKEKAIKDKEDNWKHLQQDIEKNEKIFRKLEGLQDSPSKTLSIFEDLSNKIKYLEGISIDFKKELNQIKNARVDDKKATDILGEIFNLIKAKCDYNGV